MAHEIDESTGRPAFFTLREPAWHGLGTVIKEPITCREAIELAGLNYEVTLQPIVTTEGDTISTHFATRREDTKGILGVVGARYTPLQNADAFGPFEELVDQKLIQIETAGALRNGSRMFLTCRATGIDGNIAGDQIQGYFLLANGHDGSLCLHMGFTPVRVVCSNTLAMARSHTASSLVRLKHTKSIKAVTEELVKRVDWVRNEFVLTQELYSYLASKRIVHHADLRKFIVEALDLSEDGPKTDGIVSDVLILGQSETNQTKATKNTWWGAYNAVAEYLTHESGSNDENRLISQWFGPSAKLTHEAIKIAVNYADAGNSSPTVFVKAI
jgi:phage/plasmid-like protein (TIGR03299 family)